MVDRFLQTITTAGNQPAFIHCASGNRAAAMWFVKRVLVDKWDMDKAGAEAAGRVGELISSHVIARPHAELLAGFGAA